MKIFLRQELQNWDKYTIDQGIESKELINRAAQCFYNKIINHVALDQEIYIFCGPGNNGADGLKLASLLLDSYYKVNTYITAENGSADFNKLLKNTNKFNLIKANFPEIKNNSIIIDAIFGIGLNRPLADNYKQLIDYLNSQNSFKISLDIPTGLDCDRGYIGTCFFAELVLTIEKPKLGFFIKNKNYNISNWEAIEIGLDNNFEYQTASQIELVTVDNKFLKLEKRKKFTHKYDYGHLLIVGGSKEKFGCIKLAAMAALRSGLGLVTICSLKDHAYSIVSSTPEVMASEGLKNSKIRLPKNLHSFNSIVCGMGLGLDYKTVYQLLKNYKKPLVLDADAINTIAKHNNLFNHIPEKSILTPHLGEFKRLCGSQFQDDKVIELGFSLSKKYNIIIVLKDAVTIIFTPNKIWISDFGHPVLAKAGNGDVLAGLVAGLLSQNYDSEQAAVLAVHLHSLADKYAAQSLGENFAIPSDTVYNLRKAFNHLERV